MSALDILLDLRFEDDEDQTTTLRSTARIELAALREICAAAVRARDARDAWNATIWPASTPLWAEVEDAEAALRYAVDAHRRTIGAGKP